MDDDAEIRAVAEAMLRHLGYAATLAGDGDAAVDAYEEALRAGRPFDAVLMDLTVAARTGGREAMERLRAIAPEVKAPVSSGYSNDAVMVDPARFGFAGVVPDPAS